MKIKLFVAREIQYFELGIFSFNSYVYYLTRGFIASGHAFNLPTRAFNLATRAFNLAARTFNLATRASSPLTGGFELVTRVLLFHDSKHPMACCYVCNTDLVRFLTLQRLGGEGESNQLPPNFYVTNV